MTKHVHFDHNDRDAYVNESRSMFLMLRRDEECRGSWRGESHDLQSPSIPFM